MDILVIGGGGREHSIIWKLRQNQSIEKIYCLPGNAGISQMAICDYTIKATDTEKILNFLNNNTSIKLTIVAPDDPLSLGLVNILTESGHRAFGPTKEAAIIEGSKAFSKNLMKKYNIPTAAYEIFTNHDEAISYLKNASFPLVIKADGLALGKGVIICDNFTQAKDALKEIMIDHKFGEAGSKVVIEEFIYGREVSILCFTDGKTIVPMVSSQDHKRIFDGDKGENTGGMGTFSPSKFYTKDMERRVYDEILLPTINAMNSEGRTFKGVLYFGLMIDGDKISVLEYNARFGDPEAQVVLPRLKTDLLEIIDAIIDERLLDIKINWEDCECVCVILASEGYPKYSQKGEVIKFNNIDEDVILFHSGTAFNDKGEYITNGGRVIGVTAKGRNIEEARKKAYFNVDKIEFKGKQFRKDIGYKL